MYFWCWSCNSPFEIRLRIGTPICPQCSSEAVEEINDNQRSSTDSIMDFLGPIAQMIERSMTRPPGRNRTNTETRNQNQGQRGASDSPNQSSNNSNNNNTSQTVFFSTGINPSGTRWLRRTFQNSTSSGPNDRLNFQTFRVRSSSRLNSEDTIDAEEDNSRTTRGRRNNREDFDFFGEPFEYTNLGDSTMFDFFNRISNLGRIVRRAGGNSNEEPNRPVSQNFLNSMVGTKVGKNNLEKYASKSCVICLESYKEGDIIYETKCNHFYHIDCIKKWLVINKKCPMCGAVTDGTQRPAE